jgi:oligopeptidase B
MNRRAMLCAGTSAALAVALPSLAIAQAPGAPAQIGRMPTPPSARRDVKTITQLGRTRTDAYGWMRDDNWQEVLTKPEVLRKDIREHLEAENAYLDEVLLKPTEALRETLFKEMRARIKEDDSSVPAPDGRFAYGNRFRQGGQYPILTRTPIDAAKAPSGPEQILLDGDEAAKGEKFWVLRGFSHSPDHAFVAYGVDTEGARFVTLRFRVASNGQDLGYEIPRTDGGIVWAKDSRTCFYVLVDDNVRSRWVKRHIVGTDPKTDVTIYEERDPTWQMGITGSDSGEYLFIVASKSDASEARFLPLTAPTTRPKLIHRRTRGLEYYPEHHGEHFYIRTNADGATDFKIVRAPIAAPAKANWQDVVPYRAGTLVESLSAYKNYLVRAEMVDALPRLTVRAMETGEEHAVSFPEEAFDLDMSRGFEWDTTTLRFVYQSPSTPRETWDYDMASRERVLRKRQEVPSGHDPAQYVVRRINAPSAGGAQVPITILHRKDTPVDGSAPLLLYGYGSYGISMPATFSTARFSLVNRGFIYAIAHIRGGQERGFAWYTDGKLANKQNTFTDFIASAEALIAQKFASPKRIVIQGGSAGGLLVGAVINQRPDLFGGVIAAVPFVDVMNTISDETLPLTPPEWTEWGDPIRDPKAYDTMRAYSPYENVADRPYPPILALTALSDSQVTYWEPAKWIAQLRHEAPKAGPFLLRTNMDAGHGGASGRFDSLKEVAEEWAFALWAMGKAGAG